MHTYRGTHTLNHTGRPAIIPIMTELYFKISVWLGILMIQESGNCTSQGIGPLRTSEGAQGGDLPLWPIVSFVNSPTYALSKHLVSILAPLVGKSLSHVRNSTEFASFITGQTIPQEMTMVSFDVVSLKCQQTWPSGWGVNALQRTCHYRSVRH